MSRYSWLLAAMFLISIFSITTQAKTSGGKVNALGPYTLGATYTELKELPGFVFDSSRSKPDKGIIVGKIIDKNVFNQATIQRLTFHRGKLVRVSIIIGATDFTEEQAKALVVKQWGDPGNKKMSGDSMIYVWEGSIGTILLLTADGGRQMISLADIDMTHYVE